MDDYWVWCGSVVRGDDHRYHMFASRWPKAMSFSPHWLTNSEIVRAISDTPEGPYRFEQVVLSTRGEACWDGRMTHNPAVVRHRDRYLLFYTGTTYAGETPTPDHPLPLGDPATMKDPDPRVIDAHRHQRIGLATAPDPTGPWTRLDRPVLEPRPGRWDGLITTNPAPCVTPEGRLLLIYKSVTRLGGLMHLGVAGADSPDRPFKRLSDRPIFEADARGDHVEDPFLWHEGGIYHLIMKEMNGKLGGEPRGGIALQSPDGVHWPNVASNVQRAYSRHIRWDDGTRTTQAFFERPQLLLEHGQPTHLFAATGVGSENIGRVIDTWNMVIPLGHDYPDRVHLKRVSRP